MKTIEKLLISQGQLDRIYVGSLKLFLWRSLYSISPNFDMPKIRFIQLLDQLARYADAQKRKQANV